MNVPPDPEPISPNYAQLVVNLRDYRDVKAVMSALDPWMKDGKVYGIPFTNAGNVMYYNEDIFTKAGVPTPRQLLEEGNWTWDKVREISKDLVAKGGARYGYMFGNNIFTVGWQNLVELLPPYGGAPWSADGKTCLFMPSPVRAIPVPTTSAGRSVLNGPAGQ